MRPGAANLKSPYGASDSDKSTSESARDMKTIGPKRTRIPLPWHTPALAERATLGSRPRAAEPGGGGYPPSEGPRLPVGRVLEVEDGTVGTGAEVHRVRRMDGSIEVSHGAEIVPRRVHEQPAAQAALSQPPEQSSARAAQASAETVPASAPGPAVWPVSPARRGGR